MRERLFPIFLRTAYSRSDVARQIGTLKEFFEFVFFSAREERAGKESIVRFSEYRDGSTSDRAYLDALPADFLGAFDRKSFYETLKRLASGAEDCPVLFLTVPVEFPREFVVRLGEWARREIHPKVLLEVKTDPSIFAGCRFVWENTLHDFSLSHYFRSNEEALHNKLRSRMSARQ